MAPKDEALKSKKRKRISDKKSDKKTTKDTSIKTKEKKPKSSPNKPKFLKEKSKVIAKDAAQLSKKEMRQISKERTEARKKYDKPHHKLEQELALLWEKMRQRNIAKEERSKFVTEALQKMKGKIPEIAGSHISSRVLQACVKYCSDAERNAVYEELRPHIPTLCSNTYAVHLITKMFDNASKSQLPGLISVLHGRVARLLKHSVGSVVVEHAYKKGNATQKRELLMELYSTELKLFKDFANMKETRIVDIISKLRLRRPMVVQHMGNILKPILEKGIVDHSIIHKALLEYLSIVDKISDLSAATVVKELSGLLIRIIHTKDGSKLGVLCVKHGSAKERKTILKALKGKIDATANDDHGSLVLVAILSTVDDTKLVTQVVIRELQPILKDLILSKCGRRPILQLLHPYCQRYLSPEDLASLNDSIPILSKKSDKEAKPDTKSPAEEADESMEPGEDAQLVEGGKKDPFVRRQELLLKSGLAENLVDICTESAEELLKSNFGREVLYEVATGGVDGILHPTLDEKLTILYEKIAALAALPKSDESEHIMENFHSSRTIRKLVLDCPPFALILWRAALEGKCKIWAEGHSSRVVTAFAQSSDSDVQQLTNKELQPLVDAGVLKVQDARPAEK